jgi:hypothetical protein
MSVSANRREAVAGAAAAAVVAPMLRPSSVEARDKFLRAPVITMFDGRGCREHLNIEYTGPKYVYMYIDMMGLCPCSILPDSLASYFFVARHFMIHVPSSCLLLFCVAALCSCSLCLLMWTTYMSIVGQSVMF